MRVSNIVCTGLMFFISLGSFAQQSGQKWWVIPEVGLQAGSYEPSGDLRMNGGVHYKGWLIGAGGGLDYYRFKSVPLYLQARKFIGNKRLRPFIIASAGINTPVETTVSKSNNSFWNTSIWNNTAVPPTIYTYSSGAYGELGLGYALINKKNRGLMLSLCYTQKNISESFPVQISDGTIGGIVNTTENKNYYMKRWCFRIAYIIGN